MKAGDIGTVPSVTSTIIQKIITKIESNAVRIVESTTAGIQYKRIITNVLGSANLIGIKRVITLLSR